MASQNNLLGMTRDDGGVSPLGHGFTNHYSPALRYHENYPNGKLCQTDRQVDICDAEGAVDHPGKLRRLPGLEHIYDAYVKSLKGDVDLKETEPPVLTEDEIAAAKMAEELKAESDKVEAARLEAEEAARRGPEVFKCDVCGKEYEKTQALRMHKMSAHKVK